MWWRKLISWSGLPKNCNFDVDEVRQLEVWEVHCSRNLNCTLLQLLIDDTH